MRRPFSYFNYFKANKKRVMGAIISIALSIVAISYMEALNNNSRDSQLEKAEVYSRFTLISRNSNSGITEEIIEKINVKDAVDSIIHCKVDWVARVNMTGNYIGQSVYSVLPENLDYLLDKIEYNLLDGEKPTKNNEILINEKLARYLNLKVGDLLNRDTAKVSSISNDLKIVGIISSLGNASVIYSEDKILNSVDDTDCFLIFPKKNKLNELNNFLYSIKNPNMKIRDFNTVRLEVKGTTEGFEKYISIILILVTSLLSLSLGSVFYLSYYNRRNEMGVYKALGYRNSKIVLIAAKEITINFLIAFIIGIGLSLVLITLVNHFVTYPKGQTPLVYEMLSILKCATIPVIITIFTLIPISRMLTKLDAIIIIEGKVK